MTDNKKVAELFERSLPFLTALGNPDRQQLLMLMVDGSQKSVAELTAHTNLSRPTISHHLKILKDAGIIIEHKVGRKIYYQPQAGEYFHTVKELVDVIDELIKKRGC